MLAVMSRVFRAIPDATPGKTRLARAALSLFSGPAVMRDKFGNDLYLPSVREPISLGIFACGVYEAATVAAILNEMPDGGMFLDIGANVGVISLAVAASRPGTKIVCVEADPDMVAVLRQNLLRNGIGAQVLPVAAGAETGATAFYRAPESKFGMGSIGPQFSDPIIVPQSRLDDLLDGAAPSVVKLDIEGAELGALRGLSRTLERSRPTIIFEFADWAEARIAGQSAGDAQGFLLSLGYRIFRLPSLTRIDAPMTRGSAMLVATRH